MEDFRIIPNILYKPILISYIWHTDLKAVVRMRFLELLIIASYASTSV